jgi:hypothetical protein
MALIKPVSELTTDDLEMFALWEFATDREDEGDELSVRPVDSEVVPVDEDDTVYQVACDVELANGRVLTGHVGVCNGALDPEPPTVVNDAGEAFDLEHPPHRRQQPAFEALFGAPFAEVFPVRWRLRLPLAGEPAYREGEVALPPRDPPRIH